MSIYDRKLRWCAEHDEPAWLYPDGSVQCMYDLIVEQASAPSDHALEEIAHAPESAAETLPNVHSPIDALCARHGLTVEGIVALVDDTLRDITEPEHADITEAVEAGLNHDDMYYAGWEVGYFDAVTTARRLVLGEEA